MDFLKDLIYNTGKPLSQFYTWLHKVWASFNLPPVLLDIIIQFIVALAVFVFIALNALWIIYYERKFSAKLQIRKGPNRVGPFGLLQTVADTIKLLIKEDINPVKVDKIVFFIAPGIVFLATFLSFLVIPFGNGIIVSDLSIGILYLIAVSGLAVIGILAGGWASNNKYSLIGGLRSAAQIVGYEIPSMLVVLTIVMLAGSMKMSEIISAQAGYRWFIFYQPVAFLLFIIAAAAEINRAPFDLPEAESELVSGFITEYSAMKFAFFFLAEYTNLFIVSAVATTLFLGGWQGPLLPPFVWFIIKTYAVVTFLMWIRWSFPRLRVDHLMEFSWKYLLPIALINLLITAFIIKVIG
ncbi:MAG: NADH-quinone oxidoreductase subunit NuoH [Candidatus Goldbacteria bacterium]|nr:NADH-quinone oxidoreductase subunit NuoH [Candidatus Goldiibacteriota bacterium]